MQIYHYKNKFWKKSISYFSKNMLIKLGDLFLDFARNIWSTESDVNIRIENRIPP